MFIPHEGPEIVCLRCGGDAAMVWLVEGGSHISFCGDCVLARRIDELPVGTIIERLEGALPNRWPYPQSSGLPWEQMLMRNPATAQWVRYISEEDWLAGSGPLPCGADIPGDTVQWPKCGRTGELALGVGDPRGRTEPLLVICCAEHQGGIGPEQWKVVYDYARWDGKRWELSHPGQHGVHS